MPKTTKLTDSDRFHKHIIRLVEYFQEYFYVQDHRYKIHWLIDEEESGRMQTVMRIHMGYPYLEFSITTYRPAYELFLKKEYQKLCRILVHEFCHLFLVELHTITNANITPQLFDSVADIVEKTVDRITIIAMYTINKKIWDYKP